MKKFRAWLIEKLIGVYADDLYGLPVMASNGPIGIVTAFRGNIVECILFQRYLDTAIDKDTGRTGEVRVRCPECARRNAEEFFKNFSTR